MSQRMNNRLIILKFFEARRGDSFTPKELQVILPMHGSTLRKELSRIIREENAFIIRDKRGMYRALNDIDYQNRHPTISHPSIRAVKDNISPEDLIRRRQLAKERGRAKSIQLRKALFAMYGDKCACCGESEQRFLTLDHKHSDGKFARYRANGNHFKIWTQAIMEVDPSKYQILCYNCNCGRAVNGGICPHKDVRKVDAKEG